MMKIYDTNALLLLGESVFTQEKFYISSITLNELEHIKTSRNKDDDIKYKARIILHHLAQNPDSYYIILHKQKYENIITENGYEVTNDTKILSDLLATNNDIILVTDDLALKHIAESYYVTVETINEEEDNYSGYQEIEVTDLELGQFYQDTKVNYFNLEVGEYIILKNEDGEIVDLRRWDGSDHKFIKTEPFKSTWYGTVTPYQNDIYQKLLFDSLWNNKLTMVKGPAGTGKSHVALGCLMSALEHGKIDKIIVFCNPVATINSARLGFYPGSKDEKLLDSQIGNMLSAKLGGKEGLERLMAERKLELLPFSDIRGFDTTGTKAGVYITEAQNLDRTLIKLALQRIGEDSICIIDGDDKSQVDLPQYTGYNNGMRRTSKVFRGHDFYGEVELKHIYRSKIAEIAENI